MNAWTVKEIETLLKLWPTKSATQIAREIQRSRAAVCGKMNRLRCDGVIPGYLPKHLEIDLRRKPKLNRPVQIIPIVQSSKPPPPCDYSFMTQPCSIYELDENRCHWPLGSIEERATMFCGLNSEPERSYCWHHLRASKADEDCPR